MEIEPEAVSDAQLILAANEDPDAFRRLYERYAERLHRFFVRRSNDREAALDLTAETFAQAWMSKRTFRDLAGGSAGPWLFAIARRVLAASVARRQIESTMLERLAVERTWPAAGAIPDAGWLEGLDAELEAALDSLPGDRRRALELRVLGGLPYSTIADRLGCSSTAARIRVSRSLAWLRERLEGSHG